MYPAQRVAQPVRRPHDDGLVSHLHGAGVGHRSHLRPRRHPIELQERQVGRGLGGHDSRRDRLTPEELHRDLVHAVHDVGRRHHLAVRRDQHARPGLGEARLAPRLHVPPAGPDHDHRRHHFLEHLAHGLGAGRSGRPEEQATDHGRGERQARGPPIPRSQLSHRCPPLRSTFEPIVPDPRQVGKIEATPTSAGNSLKYRSPRPLRRSDTTARFATGGGAPAKCGGAALLSCRQVLAATRMLEHQYA
jgi:hypothetical protein